MNEISVIIPVYNGYDAVRRLSGTLFDHTGSENEIIFIDDASPDPRIAPLLAGFARDHANVRVVTNETNRGFAHNANLGASLAKGDFVLLNSDTEVPANWIPRLFLPVWSAADTASATPFASWSRSHGFMEDPAEGRALCERYGIEAIDRVLATLPADPEENAIVRGYGFCLAISRRAWDAVGPFNEELFGRGYGEETDWCLRARERGFVNRLVPNLLVGHWHNGSFTKEQAKELLAAHRRILKRLHPDAPRTKCRDMPAFVNARARIREALRRAGMTKDKEQPPAKEKKRSRLLRFLAGLRPCLRRDLVPLNNELKRQKKKLMDARERTKDLEAKVTKLRETVRSLRETASEQKKLAARLRAQQTRTEDVRYLANIALPRERLRESVVRWWYARHPDIPLNLDSPRTFCEKIQRLKLTADTPLMTRLADKFAVREWIAGKIGEKYLVPLLGVWDRAEDVDLSALPRKFVLKANHGSHMMHIVTDKSALDLVALRAEMNRWLETNYAFVMSPQLQYANIPRKIIAEEYLENGGKMLDDWKVWCYRGKAHYVEFLSRHSERLQFVFMDRSGREAPFTYSLPSMEKITPPPTPDNFGELLDLAETLADGFEFVRTDFYRLDDGSYRFGEMTFSPTGGNGRFDPPEWNERIGDLFDYTPDNRLPTPS